MTPAKSMRLHFDTVDFATGIRTAKKTPAVDSTLQGTKMIKTQRHPMASWIQPLKGPPRAAPTPYITLPTPIHTPRLRSGIRSEMTKVVIAFMPPPPKPATTRPAIIAASV